MPEQLTVQEAATHLRVSYWTVLNHIKDGSLPAARFGRRYLVSRSALEGLLAKNANTTTP